MLWNLKVQYLVLDRFNIKDFVNIGSRVTERNVDLKIGTQSCKISLFL